jgi:Zn-dependent protease
MTPSTAWPMPFVIAPQNLAVDSIVTFCVSVLLAVMINNEAQAFVSSSLGDTRVDAKDRFNFNAFLHLSILGSICYLVAGFGWPRVLDIDRSKFKHPRLYMVISRLAGPVANLVLAGIGGSFVFFMKFMDWDPRVFLMVIGVNITTAVYNLIPLPPMALGFAVCELFPDEVERTKAILLQVGPFILLALAFLDRLAHQGVLTPYFDPLIKTVYAYITSM